MEGRERLGGGDPRLSLGSWEVRAALILHRAQDIVSAIPPVEGAIHGPLHNYVGAGYDPQAAGQLVAIARMVVHPNGCPVAGRDGHIPGSKNAILLGIV